jgi:hypothetical protein
MMYLLDVNALVALGFQQHKFPPKSDRVAANGIAHAPGHLLNYETGIHKILAQTFLLSRELTIQFQLRLRHVGMN